MQRRVPAQEGRKPSFSQRLRSLTTQVSSSISSSIGGRRASAAAAAAPDSNAAPAKADGKGKAKEDWGEYQMVHSPDRPAKIVTPMEAPSEDECGRLLLEMQRRKATLRRERILREGGEEPVDSEEDPDEGDMLALLSPQYGGLGGKKANVLGPKPLPLPPLRKPPPQKQPQQQPRFETMNYGDKWMNPRAAPWPSMKPQQQQQPLASPGYFAPGHTQQQPVLSPLGTEYSPMPSYSHNPIYTQHNDAAHPSPAPAPATAPEATPNPEGEYRNPSPPPSPRSTSATVDHDSDYDNNAADDDETPPSHRTAEEGQEGGGTSSGQNSQSQAAEAKLKLKPPRRCRMPACNGLAVRGTRGLCDVCEHDFAPTPSVFYSSSDNLRLLQLQLQQQGEQQGGGGGGRRRNPLFPLLPVSVPMPVAAAQEQEQEKEKERDGHIAHQMAIHTPGAAPQDILVPVSGETGNGGSGESRKGSPTEQTKPAQLPASTFTTSAFTSAAADMAVTTDALLPSNKDNNKAKTKQQQQEQEIVEEIRALTLQVQQTQQSTYLHGRGGRWGKQAGTPSPSGNGNGNGNGRHPIALAAEATHPDVAAVYEYYFDGRNFSSPSSSLARSRVVGGEGVVSPRASSSSGEGASAGPAIRSQQGVASMNNDTVYDNKGGHHSAGGKESESTKPPVASAPALRRVRGSLQTDRNKNRDQRSSANTAASASSSSQEGRGSLALSGTFGHPGFI